MVNPLNPQVAGDESLAAMIARALSTQIGDPLKRVGGNVLGGIKEKGLGLGALEGLSPGNFLNEFPLGQELMGGLDQKIGALGTGAKNVAGVGVGLLAGERGKRGLTSAFDAAFGEDPPPLGPLANAAQPGPAEALAPTAIPTPAAPPGAGPFELPDLDLPPLRPGPVPDFSAAREALGEPPELQQVDMSEQLGRLFGGQAGGGLAALQNAPSGRAATLGEVIAGIGSGGGAAAAQTGAENRALMQAHQEQVARQQAQESRIAIAEEASRIDIESEEGRQYAERSMVEAQHKIQQAVVNHQASLPIPMSGGYWDTGQGKFVPTASTYDTVLKNIQGLSDMFEKAGARPVQFAGHHMVRVGLQAGEQHAADIVTLGGQRPEMMVLIADVMEQQGFEVLADQVREIAQSGNILLGDKDANDVVTSRFITAGIHIVQKQLEAIDGGITDPEQLPFGDAFLQDIDTIRSSVGQFTEQGILGALGAGQ